MNGLVGGSVWMIKCMILWVVQYEWFSGWFSMNGLVGGSV